MFFPVAKVSWFFAQPLSIAILLVLAGLVTLALRRRRPAWIAIGLGTLILALSSWTTAGDLIISPLESRFAQPDPAPAHVDGMIVLGGAFEGAINVVRHGYEMNSAGDRMVAILALSRRYPDARIVVSGGNGLLVGDAEGDGVTAVRFFDAMCVPSERIAYESRSRDTYENAVFTKELVRPKPGETWLLVTSAYHMPRSVGIFRHVGFDVTPWPVDYRTSGREGFALFADYPTDALQTTTIALREWVGLLAYRLSGRTDELFPSPSSSSPASTTSRASE